MKKLITLLSAAALILAGCEDTVNSLLSDDGKSLSNSISPGTGSAAGFSITHNETIEEISGETVITYTLNGTIDPTKNKFTPGSNVYKAFYEEEAGAATPESILAKDGKVTDKNGGKYTIVALPWSDLRRMLLSAGLTAKDTFVVNEVNPSVFQESGGIYNSDSSGAPYPKVNVDPAPSTALTPATPAAPYLHTGWVAGGTHDFTVQDAISKKDAMYYFVAIDINTNGKADPVNGDDPDNLTKPEEYVPPAAIELKFYKLIPTNGTLPSYDSDSAAIAEDSSYTTGLDEDKYQLVLVLRFENRLTITPPTP
jgi:hypothetical protein